MQYNLPVRLVNRVADKLLQAKLIYEIKIDDNKEGLGPAVEVSELTLGRFYRDFNLAGNHNIIPDFDVIYADMLRIIGPLAENSFRDYNQVLIKDIPLPSPEEIHKILVKDEVKG